MKKLATIQFGASLSVTAAYCIHGTIGGKRYRLMAIREPENRIWQTACRGLIMNSEYASEYEDIELHDIYANSLNTAVEVRVTRQYLHEMGISGIEVKAKPFPLPLPKGYSGIDSSEDSYNPIIREVGNCKINIPAPLLCLLYHSVGGTTELLDNFNFDDEFITKQRFEILSKGFLITRSRDDWPLNFKMLAYEEPEGCFIDNLKNVHDRIVVQHESEKEGPSDARS